MLAGALDEFPEGAPGVREQRRRLVAPTGHPQWPKGPLLKVVRRFEAYEADLFRERPHSLLMARLQRMCVPDAALKRL